MTTITQETRFQRTRSSTVSVALVAAALLVAASPAAVAQCGNTKGDLLVHSGCTYTVSGDESFATIRIESTGKVIIPKNSSLTVTRTLDVSSGGAIEFSAATGNAGRFYLSATVRMDGTFKATGSVGGRILNCFGDNLLVIAATGKIEAPSGPMTIAVQTEMDGKVLANGTCSYAITFTKFIHPGSSGRFEVTGSSASMVIDTGASADIDALAQVLVTAGTFYLLDGRFKTDGGVKVTGGMIKVEWDSTPLVFQATGPYVDED
jgi:hypothetical protein